MPEKKIYIGWGEKDITPENTKAELSGQYYQRIAIGVHSRISVTAVVFQRDDTQSIMASMDLVGLPGNMVTRVREAVAAKNSEIKTDAIFLNVIHTHSAPYTEEGGLFRDWTPIDDTVLDPNDYVPFLVQQIADAILEAWNNRKPGGIRPAFANARIGHCRRAVYSTGKAEMYGDTTRRDYIGMEAGEDSGVELMFTYDENSRPTGLILNVACPSQVMESTYYISSDYMGATRELLKKEFGEGFHTLCQISAAGCQSPRDLTRNGRTEPDFWHADGVVEISNRLFYAVMHPTYKGIINFEPEFKQGSKQVVLPIRRVSYPEYIASKKRLKELTDIMPAQEAYKAFVAETHANEAIPNRPGPYDSKLHHFVLIENEEANIARYESQDAHPNVNFEMQYIRLGDCAFVNNPFELYLVYGQMIKARAASRQTFIIQLCSSNGNAEGYLPSPEAEKFGGYGGLVINGTAGSAGGYKLVDEAVNAIDSLF